MPFPKNFPPKDWPPRWAIREVLAEIKSLPPEAFSVGVLLHQPF